MRIMAVDYGDVRTGIALCDQEERLASPYTVYHERRQKELIEQIQKDAAEQRVEKIVVGYPLNMDGSAGERAQKCKSFAQLLQQSTGLPVVLWDERGTTVSAHQVLNVTDTRGKKRKAVVDAVSAVLILETYLHYRKFHNEDPQYW